MCVQIYNLYFFKFILFWNPKFLGKLNFIFICLICIHCEKITTIGAANTHYLIDIIKRKEEKEEKKNTFLLIKRTQDLLS